MKNQLTPNKFMAASALLLAAALLAAPTDVAATDYPAEDASAPRGTYGATGSGADFVDDLRFAGTGVLGVLRDDLLNPALILIR